MEDASCVVKRSDQQGITTNGVVHRPHRVVHLIDHHDPLAMPVVPVANSAERGRNRIRIPKAARGGEVAGCSMPTGIDNAAQASVQRERVLDPPGTTYVGAIKHVAGPVVND